LFRNIKDHARAFRQWKRLEQGNAQCLPPLFSGVGFLILNMHLLAAHNST
jgi:hypothetical protein